MSISTHYTHTHWYLVAIINVLWYFTEIGHNEPGNEHITNK